MRKLTALLLTVLLLFGSVGIVSAATLEDQHYFSNQIHVLIDAGKMSSNEIYGIYIDLAGIPQGSVTSTVYETEQQLQAITLANVTPQTIEGVNGAKDKLARFWAYLYNNQEGNLMGGWGSAPDNSIMQFVYGPQKTEILDTYVAGIPECIGNTRLYDHGNSDSSNNGISVPEITKETVEEKPDTWAEKYTSTAFSLNATTYTTTTKSVTDTSTLTTTKTMDVAPYVKDGRTYVPVRYLAYSLGVSEEDIVWTQASQQVTITLNDKLLILAIGSNVMLVNGEEVIMDVAPEAVDGRTMLPARWIAEALGATVEWDASLNQAIIIMPTTN